MFHRRRPKRKLDPLYPIHGFKILGPVKPLRADYAGEIEGLKKFWEVKRPDDTRF